MIANKLNDNVNLKHNTIIDKSVDFIVNEQLYDEELWDMLVNQFKVRHDVEDNGWRGEFWGKLMRGGVFVYKYTRDDKLYAILEKAVKGLLETQDELGRIATYTTDYEFIAWDLWCRKYVMLGLEYFYDICKCEELKKNIVAALIKHADYIIDHIGEGKIEINELPKNYLHGLNSSSILEPYVMLYNLSGEKRYLDFAEYIIARGGSTVIDIFETAYENKIYPYDYPVKKAYEMMSCFEGLLEYYKVTGNEKYLTSVENFVKQIAESEITIVGSAGCDGEFFNNSSKKQIHKNDHESEQETCVTVTWMKLCYKLLLLTGKAKYADYIEQSMYNAMIGAINTDFSNANCGMVFDSYSPLVREKRGQGMGGIKTLNYIHIFGCCVAIGAAGVGISALLPVLKGADEVVFNTYLNGDVACDLENGKAFKATVDTAYPYGGNIKITVTDADNCTVKLRVPEFAENAKLALNGKEVDAVIGYNSLTVNSGDEITLFIDCEPKLVSSKAFDKDSEEKFVFRAGPVVLASDKRLSEIPEKLCTDGIKIEKAEVAIASNTAYKVTTKDSEFLLVDYASAGKTWKKDSELCVWF